MSLTSQSSRKELSIIHAGMTLIVIMGRGGKAKRCVTQRNASMLLVDTSHNRILRLARRSALKEPSAYVGVSYCWNREPPERSANISDKPLEVVCGNMARRSSNTPPDALYQSMAYAETQNVNALWIDQECIDQSDPIDKENGIQEIDLVYHESDYPIAVLEFSFQSQTELDSFASVCDQALYNFDPARLRS